jgi:murein DD-endopeptidase MepM/ murein hydrolase activator NlpD
MESLTYPAPKEAVSQPFGHDNSKHPKRKSFYQLFDDKHPGVDFALRVGTSVRSAYSGVVVRREFHQGMGNVLGIRNSNIVCLYAHLSKFKVKLADVVNNGQVIGLSGDTGKACLSPHLHFEIRDITKPSLKQMVFNPPFNKLIPQYTPQFTYTVNNTNTKKTWEVLAKVYFGTKVHWQKIKEVNPNIKLGQNTVLPHGVKITIPNYKPESEEPQIAKPTSGFGKILNKTR